MAQLAEFWNNVKLLKCAANQLGWDFAVTIEKDRHSNEPLYK
jgi:hypothetical protein